MLTVNNSAVPPLKDRDDLDSEVTPDDLRQPEPEPTERDEDILATMEERYKAAAAARQPREPAMFLSLAFYLGEQNLGWSTNRGRLIDTRDPAADWRSYTVRNLIKGKVLTILGQATQTAPTAIVAPLTGTDVDVRAAQEARALLAHLDRLHDRGAQTSEALLWALTSSTACLKLWWDPDAEADIPILDKGGGVTGATRGPVGEICEEVVPAFDLYLDPSARKWERLGWIIHEQVRDLAYVQRVYGQGADGPDGARGPGWRVKGDTGAGNAGYIESRMASVVGDAQGGAGAGAARTVAVRECWEFPGARYPKGRLFTTAGGVVLREPEDWPTEHCPFVPLDYLKGLGTVWGVNAVWDCIGAQRTYNAAIRAQEEYLSQPQGKWMVPRGAEIDPDSLNDPREAVYFNDPFKPQYFPPPPAPAIIQQAIEVADSNLNDLSGVRSVSEGDTPPGVTAASAIAQLTASDATQLKHCLTNLETFHRKRAEIEIALAAKFYGEPRLIGVQDVKSQDVKPQDVTQDAAAAPGGLKPGTDPAPLTEYKAFKALTEGGSCRVSVVPGSAIPQSPQARQQQMGDLFKMLLGGGPPSPDMLAIFIAMLKGMEIEGGDAVVEELAGLLQKMQADKAAADAAAQAAQQQAQAAQAQQAQALQQGQINGDLLKKVTDQQHEVGMKQNELGGHLAKMAATHALGQHEKAQAALAPPMMPPGGDPQGGPPQPPPQAPTPQGDAL